MLMVILSVAQLYSMLENIVFSDFILVEMTNSKPVSLWHWESTGLVTQCASAGPTLQHMDAYLWMPRSPFYCLLS